MINISDLQLSVNATISREIVFQSETTKIVRITISINGTKYNYTITTTKIYSKAWSDEETYRNITMILQKIETENITSTTYTLFYNVTNLAGEYRSLITTTLTRSASSVSWGQGFMRVIYMPSREYTATLGLVSFNFTPTLSQHYRALSQVAKKLREKYERNNKRNNKRTAIKNIPENINRA